MSAKNHEKPEKLENLKKILANNIIMYMANQEISKTDLAFDCLNNYTHLFSLSYIRKILKGKANPTLESLFNLSEKLNVTVSDLLKEGENYGK